jgi:hypothetical protein
VPPLGPNPSARVHYGGATSVGQLAASPIPQFPNSMELRGQATSLAKLQPSDSCCTAAAASYKMPGDTGQSPRSKREASSTAGFKERTSTASRAPDLACGVQELTAEATQAACHAPARSERRPRQPHASSHPTQAVLKPPACPIPCVFPPQFHRKLQTFVSMHPKTTAKPSYAQVLRSPRSQAPSPQSRQGASSILFRTH